MCGIDAVSAIYLIAVYARIDWARGIFILESRGRVLFRVLQAVFLPTVARFGCGAVTQEIGRVCECLQKIDGRR